MTDLNLVHKILYYVINNILFRQKQDTGAGPESEKPCNIAAGWDVHKG
jgi:hypothetical protein